MKGRSTTSNKQVPERDSRKVKRRDEIPDIVAKRVSKKLAKVMYQRQDQQQFPSRVCNRIGSKVEAVIKKQAANFEDYKRKVIHYLQLVESSPGLFAEINRNFENDSLEEWLSDEMLPSV